ncbi:MAG: FAD-dependent monooxygenase, partial [Burkholderiaceae bacterium]
MARQMVIAGGGIGGLAAALSGARAGWNVRLHERTSAFAEVGAGIQIGPNVTRVLQNWGLSAALESVAAFPERLEVRDAVSGGERGVLRLGATARTRYGAPYATVHRADLLELLLSGLRQQTDAAMLLGSAVVGFADKPQGVVVQTTTGPVDCDALLGADGLWSTVRQSLLGDGSPRATGHAAYRALVPQSALGESLRSQQVTVWLGRRLHVVQYPVRRGEWLNVVAILQDDARADAGTNALASASASACERAEGRTGAPAKDSEASADWNLPADRARLRRALAASCPALRTLVDAIDSWQRWTLFDRASVRAAAELARGRVGLLG